MKEMIYQENRKQEILYVGEYKGYKYLILSMGIHPTAYVEIPEGHKLNGVNYDDIDIDVHGGLTYGHNGLLGIESNCYYIGWDYAHYGDYSGCDMLFPKDLKSNDKKWTTEEIKNDCESVIRQIVDMDEEDYLELLPEDELYPILDSKVKINKNKRIDFNFRVLKDKINELVEEINEIRKNG